VPGVVTDTSGTAIHNLDYHPYGSMRISQRWLSQPIEAIGRAISRLSTIVPSRQVARPRQVSDLEHERCSRPRDSRGQTSSSRRRFCAQFANLLHAGRQDNQQNRIVPLHGAMLPSVWLLSWVRADGFGVFALGSSTIILIDRTIMWQGCHSRSCHRGNINSRRREPHPSSHYKLTAHHSPYTACTMLSFLPGFLRR